MHYRMLSALERLQKQHNFVIEDSSGWSLSFIDKSTTDGDGDVKLVLKGAVCEKIFTYLLKHNFQRVNVLPAQL